MTNKKRRKKAAQIILIREIVICIITLAAISFALFFLLKNHATSLENDELKEQLAVYQDINNPYYSSEEVRSMINEATLEATQGLYEQGQSDVLDLLKDTMSSEGNGIEVIRKFYPNDIILSIDDKYLFVPIDDSLTKSEYDNSLYLRDGEFILYNDSNVVTTKGIDVSKFQQKINWEKVAKSDIDYAIIRIGTRGYSEGGLLEDPTFEDNIKGALNNDIEVGVYFLTQAVSDEEALEEAQYVLDEIEPYNVTYPIVVDVEMVGGSEGRGNALSKEERTQYVITFCEAIKKSGYTPMIYGNLRTFLLMLDMKLLEEYPKWFAGYTDYPAFPYKYDMWQYTDTGDIEGIPTGAVDINICFINSNNKN